MAKVNAKKGVTKCKGLRGKPDPEIVAEVLANPEYLTREAQATALQVTTKTLWLWLKNNPAIAERGYEIAKEQSNRSMTAGYNRLDRIIRQGRRDEAAVSAITTLAKLRGEFVDKRDVKLNGNVLFGWLGKCPKPKKL